MPTLLCRCCLSGCQLLTAGRGCCCSRKSFGCPSPSFLQSLDPEQLAPYFPISGAAAVLQQGACLAAWSLLAAWAAGQA